MERPSPPGLARLSRPLPGARQPAAARGATYPPRSAGRPGPIGGERGLLRPPPPLPPPPQPAVLSHAEAGARRRGGGTNLRQLGGGAKAAEQRGVLGGARRGEAPPPPLRLGKRTKAAFHQRGSRSPLPESGSPAARSPGRGGGGERGEQPRAGRQTKTAARRSVSPESPWGRGRTRVTPPQQGRPRLPSAPVPKQKRRAGGGWGERAAGGCGRPPGRNAPPPPCQAAGGRGGERRGGRLLPALPVSPRGSGRGSRAMRGAGQGQPQRDRRKEELSAGPSRPALPPPPVGREGPRAPGRALPAGPSSGSPAAPAGPARPRPLPPPQRTGRAAAGTGGKHR
ncbi:basic salivary proline-rich protein 1-like [Ammospiza caudacuta]|uniref:basic salivary proline-rich protein 1-like n=1 Tax=Ammospiza caudacuta TaxID=2857398 RepID=UPI0027397524|nr:basic salivary proline-rich protein 1-like [Ammospiza caudacuta]